MGKHPEDIFAMINDTRKYMEYNKNSDERRLQQYEENLKNLNRNYSKITYGVWLDFNTSFVNIQKQFKAGQFVVAYYKADRVFSSIEPKHVE